MNWSAGDSKSAGSAKPGTERQAGRFINTAVPRFDGTVCWQQHQQVFNAITRSNSCGDETAARQLFEHMEGEALNVALLMPEG